MTIAQAVEDFLEHCCRKDLAPDTLAFYGPHLNRFSGATGPNLPVKKLTQKHVMAWLDSLTANPGGKAAMWRSLRTFLNYLHDEGLTETRLTKGINVKAPQANIPALTYDQCKALMRAARTSLYPHRDQAMLLVFADTGIRRREMADLKLTDFDQQNELLMVRRGKTGNPRPVVVGRKTAQYLKRYINTDRALLAPRGSSDALWLRREGRAMSPDSFLQRLKDLGEEAGLDVHVGPRVMRHTMTRLWLLEGGDMETLRKQGGWKDYKQIQTYASLSHEDVKEVHKRVGPSNKI